MDIFRSLNQLLLTYKKRVIAPPNPVIPHPFVTTGFLQNIQLLIGGVAAENIYEPGFLDTIHKNFEGDRALVRERLQQEKKIQMLRAAVDALIEHQTYRHKNNEFR